MLKAMDLRKGKAVYYNDEIYFVHDAQHVVKGNKRSYMQTKLKSLKSGVIREVRFGVDDRLEVPYIESKKYEFLYQDGPAYVLMDKTTFDQISVEVALFGDAARFLKPNETVSATICEEKIISVELPNVVELEVSDTAPSIKGATATNQLKDAILETGVKVKVPPFIANGERIRVDTRTGEYMDRAK